MNNNKRRSSTSETRRKKKFSPLLPAVSAGRENQRYLVKEKGGFAWSSGQVHFFPPSFVINSVSKTEPDAGGEKKELVSPWPQVTTFRANNSAKCSRSHQVAVP